MSVGALFMSVCFLPCSSSCLVWSVLSTCLASGFCEVHTHRRCSAFLNVLVVFVLIWASAGMCWDVHLWLCMRVMSRMLCEPHANNFPVPAALAVDTVRCFFGCVVCAGLCIVVVHE